MPLKIKSNKVDFVACYEALASGEPINKLFERYPKVEVLAALELFSKRITLRQLEEFIAKRDAHLAFMRREEL